MSDHGYMLGQHGRFEKHTSYEEAVRAAGDSYRDASRQGACRDLCRTGGSRAHVHSLCDFPLAGPLQAHAAPVLAGRPRSIATTVVEYANEEAMIRRYWKLVCNGTVRRGRIRHRWALVHNRFRLYDLHQDRRCTCGADPATATRCAAARPHDHLAATARDVPRCRRATRLPRQYWYRRTSRVGAGARGGGGAGHYSFLT
jgi:hypothetical protein